MSDVDLRVRPPTGSRGRLSGLPAALARRTERIGPKLVPGLRMVARPLGLYLASRIAVYLVIYVIVMLHLGLSVVHFHGVWPVNPPGRPLVEGLGVWDGAWYLRIAGHGYTTVLSPASPDTHTVAFLPLLPLIVRATAEVTGLNVLHAGVVDVFVIGAIASVGVWALARRLTDAATADRATALWCFFPGAVTLSLVYTEGLVVVLAVICIFALMRRRWVVAGLAAALAGATAPEGLALVACCAWAAGAALLPAPGRPTVATAPARPMEPDGPTELAVTRTGRRPWSALLAPLLAPMGWFAYQGYLWARTGDPTFWYQVEKMFWNGGFNPWMATFGRASSALHHPTVPDLIVPTLGLVVLAAAAILLWQWKPPALVTIFAAVTMAMVLASGPLGARPRFFIVAFPFIIALARPLRGPAFHALLGTSALCLAILTIFIVAATNATLDFHSLAFTP